MKNEIAFIHFFMCYQCVILLICTEMRYIDYNSHLSLPAAILQISETVLETVSTVSYKLGLLD